MIGTCSCGAQNVTIAVTQIASLIDRGTTEAICKSCEQRILGKLQQRKAAELKRKGVPQREINDAVAALAERVQSVTTATDANKGE
jgi:hypothetical protein